MKVLVHRKAAEPAPKAWLRLESWAGRVLLAVEVVGETKTRYRIRAIAGPIRLPGGRLMKGTDTAQVPKYAIKFEGKQAPRFPFPR